MLYPLSTEKSLRLLESDNMMVFAVGRNATKLQIKKEFENSFKAKVTSINILLTPKGVRKAYIRLSPETPALDVATQLGMM